jgi:tight adherence protein B
MLVAFVAGVLILVAGYSLLSDLYLRDRTRVRSRLDEEFRLKQREKARQSVLFKDIETPGGEVAGAPGTATQPGLKERFELMVEQSGLDLAPRTLTLIMGWTALLVGGGVWFIRQNPLMGLAAGAIAGLVPFLYVRFKQKQRLAKLLSQLPDAFDLMGRVIRAGQTMSQAFQAVADEFDPPVAYVYSYCFEQQNLGLPPELALRDMARRTGILELKIFVLAMLVQQQTGGNLAEMLEKLANVVRERFRVQAKVKTLTAEGRFQAAVLLAMPPAMLALMMVLNYDYASILIERPSLLATAFISEFVGALWIRKIVNFDY